MLATCSLIKFNKSPYNHLETDFDEKPSYVAKLVLLYNAAPLSNEAKSWVFWSTVKFHDLALETTESSYGHFAIFILIRWLRG